MNFAQMLLRPAMPPENRTSNHHSIKRAANRYKELLEGQQKTVTQIAEALDYTYEGTYATIGRMKARGQVIVVGHLPSTGGRRTELLTWA